MNPANPPRPAPAARRARTQFWLAVLIFFGPLLAAFVIYRWLPEWLPQGRTNYGLMVDPPRPLPPLHLQDAQGGAVDAAAFRGRWSLLYLGTANCEDDCRQSLHFARQLWLALNEKRDALQRAYIAPDAAALAPVQDALAPTQTDLRWLAASADARDALQRFFAPPDGEDMLYLVDPFGNWIMSYPLHHDEQGQQLDFKGMQKDLKKLLKL